MIKLLSPLAYRVLPWKNGGGSTTEIAVEPEGATWEAFDWRVAIADIRESGPFSSFPGIDRSIMLIDAPRGTAMELRIDGRRAALNPRTFVDFPGEATTEGILYVDPTPAGSGGTGPVAGPGAVRDFNVMSRRGVVRHRRGCQLLSHNEVYRMGGVDTRIAYVAAGTAELIHAQNSRMLNAGESVIASGDDTLELKGGAGGAQLVWVVFSKTSD